MYTFLIEYLQHPFVDKSKVYLTGNSMGGYGAWALAMAHPELFVAIVPIFGGGLAWNAGMLKSMSIWSFHYVGDTVVPCQNTIEMVENVKKHSQKDVKITIYPTCSRTEAYKNQKVYDWLVEKSL